MVCLVTSFYIPPYGERLPPKPFSYQYVVNGSLSRTEVSFPDIRVVESRHTADHRQGYKDVAENNGTLEVTNVRRITTPSQKGKSSVFKRKQMNGGQNLKKLTKTNIALNKTSAVRQDILSTLKGPKKKQPNHKNHQHLIKKPNSQEVDKNNDKIIPTFKDKPKNTTSHYVSFKISAKGENNRKIDDDLYELDEIEKMDVMKKFTQKPTYKPIYSTLPTKGTNKINNQKKLSTENPKKQEQIDIENSFQKLLLSGLPHFESFKVSSLVDPLKEETSFKGHWGNPSFYFVEVDEKETNETIPPVGANNFEGLSNGSNKYSKEKGLMKIKTIKSRITGSKTKPTIQPINKSITKSTVLVSEMKVTKEKDSVVPLARKNTTKVQIIINTQKPNNSMSSFKVTPMHMETRRNPTQISNNMKSLMVDTISTKKVKNKLNLSADLFSSDEEASIYSKSQKGDEIHTQHFKNTTKEFKVTPMPTIIYMKPTKNSASNKEITTNVREVSNIDNGTKFLIPRPTTSMEIENSFFNHQETESSMELFKVTRMPMEVIINQANIVQKKSSVSTEIITKTKPRNSFNVTPMPIKIETQVKSLINSQEMESPMEWFKVTPMSPNIILNPTDVPKKKINITKPNPATTKPVQINQMKGKKTAGNPAKKWNKTHFIPKSNPSSIQSKSVAPMVRKTFPHKNSVVNAQNPDSSFDKIIVTPMTFSIRNKPTKNPRKKQNTLKNRSSTKEPVKVTKSTNETPSQVKPSTNMLKRITKDTFKVAPTPIRNKIKEIKSSTIKPKTIAPIAKKSFLEENSVGNTGNQLSSLKTVDVTPMTVRIRKKPTKEPVKVNKSTNETPSQVKPSTNTLQKITKDTFKVAPTPIRMKIKAIKSSTINTKTIVPIAKKSFLQENSVGNTGKQPSSLKTVDVTPMTVKVRKKPKKDSKKKSDKFENTSKPIKVSHIMKKTLNQVKSSNDPLQIDITMDTFKATPKPSMMRIYPYKVYPYEISLQKPSSESMKLNPKDPPLLQNANNMKYVGNSHDIMELLKLSTIKSIISITTTEAPENKSNDKTTTGKPTKTVELVSRSSHSNLTTLFNANHQEVSPNIIDYEFDSFKISSVEEKNQKITNFGTAIGLIKLDFESVKSKPEIVKELMPIPMKITSNPHQHPEKLVFNENKTQTMHPSDRNDSHIQAKMKKKRVENTGNKLMKEIAYNKGLNNIRAESKSSRLPSFEVRGNEKDNDFEIQDIAKKIRNQLESSEVQRKVMAYKYTLKDRVNRYSQKVRDVNNEQSSLKDKIQISRNEENENALLLNALKINSFVDLGNAKLKRNGQSNAKSKNANVNQQTITGPLLNSFVNVGTQSPALVDQKNIEYGKHTPNVITHTKKIMNSKKGSKPLINRFVNIGEDDETSVLNSDNPGSTRSEVVKGFVDIGIHDGLDDLKNIQETSSDMFPFNKMKIHDYSTKEPKDILKDYSLILTDPYSSNYQNSALAEPHDGHMSIHGIDGTKRPVKLQTIVKINDAHIKPEPSQDVKDGSAKDDSENPSIFDILIQDKNSVTSKLSKFFTTVMSTKKSIICDIKITALEHLQSVVGKKLQFLKSIIGSDALESKVGEEEARIRRSFNC